MSSHRNDLCQSSMYSLYKYLSCVLFFITTGLLFVYLNKIQPYYFIDEVFHASQTLHYCAGNFTVWNPKITTLPGLYLLTAAILSPMNLCGTIAMRCINLIGTLANLYLSYQLVKQIHKYNEKWPDWMYLTLAYNITLFPPLFFWFFLYYTDVVSVNIVLLTFLLHLKEHYKVAAVVGFLGILIRQTNVIWIVFIAMERTLDLLHQKKKDLATNEALNNPIAHLKFLQNILTAEMYNGRTAYIKFITKIIMNLFPYISVGIIFIVFIVWNKGIVVGDHNAHIPTIHIPQIFYFSSFVLCFLWPYLIPHWQKFLLSIQKHLILSSIIIVVMTIIVHSNTLVHPYVLADNRHYVFYIWNKFMGRYVIMKYLLIPIYCFAIFSMLCCISHLRFFTQMAYIICLSAVLVPQLLLEPRYFIIPYILYRLNIKRPKPWQLIMESLTNLTVNFLQFFIFVNKVFYWQDQIHPQRISW